MIEYTARITSQDTPRVGGRNLFRKEYLRSNYISLAYSIPLEAINPREGDNTYILSFDYKISPEDKASSPRITCLYTGNKNIFWDSNVVRDGEWHHKEYTIQIKETDPSKYPINGWFADYGSANGRTIDMVAVRNIKLERGTIATDWTPAPEDVAESISTVNTSLVSLASTLLDPNEGDIPQLFRQQENLSHAIGSKASQEDLNKYVTNIADVTNAIQSQLCDMSVFGISNSGYVDVKTRDTCPAPGQTILNGDLYAPTEYHTSQIRLTLRTDHDALARQVSDLQLQLNRCNLRLTATKQELDKLKATTAITPVLNTDTRKRSGSTTLYPQYGDWLLTSDSQEQYISFSGLSAEIGRSIYIQTRRKAYLNANGHSFLGLPSVSENQWLSNNTTYRFVRASATAWLVTSSSSPYPWT